MYVLEVLSPENFSNFITIGLIINLIINLKFWMKSDKPREITMLALTNVFILWLLVLQIGKLLI